MSRIPWSYRLYRLTWSALDLMFPPVCGGCGKTGSRWCSDCQSRVPRINRPYCEICGIPTRKGADICERCKANPPAYRKMRSWAVFDSPVQNALHTLKYRRNISLGDSIALSMMDFMQSLAWEIDMLVPAPLGGERFRERGYNQVALVARPLAYEMEWEYAPEALQKVRETRSQVGLTVLERRENVSKAYQADRGRVNRKTVLLMDDVSTTGSTISSCTEALLAAGAREVYALTMARALSHHDLSRV